jgi:hypothetical protein
MNGAAGTGRENGLVHIVTGHHVVVAVAVTDVVVDVVVIVDVAILVIGVDGWQCDGRI